MESREVITDLADVSGQGTAKGKREYSSTATNRYLFSLSDCRGPLKSTLMRSIGFVAFINVCLSGLKNIGFYSLHVRH